MKRIFALFAVLLIMSISVLAIANPISAQSIPKPSVPQFNLTFVPQAPTDAAPTYGVDHYTGKTLMLSPGYHIDNSFIQITIKNQAFTSYKAENGRYVCLFHNFSYKGHNEADWNYIEINYFYSDIIRYDYRQPDSNFTTLKYLLNAHKENSSEIDFRVQAKIGYYTMDDNRQVFHISFTGQTSDWSNLQTISIPETSTIPTPTISLTPSPTLGQILSSEMINPIYLIAMAAVIVMLFVAIVTLVHFRRRKGKS